MKLFGQEVVTALGPELAVVQSIARAHSVSFINIVYQFDLVIILKQYFAISPRCSL
jgi:hypothetical protein